MVTEQEIEAIGKTLVDPKQPLQARFRALFTLRGLGGPDAISWISRGFEDSSALLKHELAYCLGQMRDARAIPVLADVLQDTSQEPMVRHEAGEALGAIGNPEVLGLLKQYSTDPVVEVAETCQLAVGRLEWLQQHPGEATCAGPYLSVDPAPPAAEQDVGRLREALLDEARPLFERYRAMFALRNVGGKEAALALAEGLQCGSALFRHEVGYVLGQLQHEAAVPGLAATLARTTESPMVRHECAEALGAIARISSMQTGWSACGHHPNLAPGCLPWGCLLCCCPGPGHVCCASHPDLGSRAAEGPCVPLASPPCWVLSALWFCVSHALHQQRWQCRRLQGWESCGGKGVWGTPPIWVKQGVQASPSVLHE